MKKLLLSFTFLLSFCLASNSFAMAGSPHKGCDEIGNADIKKGQVYRLNKNLETAFVGKNWYLLSSSLKMEDVLRNPNARRSVTLSSGLKIKILKIKKTNTITNGVHCYPLGGVINNDNARKYQYITMGANGLLLDLILDTSE